VPSVIRAQRHHGPAIAVLLEEMDRFYGTTEFEPIEQRVRQIEEQLFSDQPAAHILLAAEQGDVIGVAAYSFIWPAVGITRSLYLKELYVSKEYRRSGVGQLLMQRLVEVATETGCSRIEWTTDVDNADAQQFYATLGYSPHRGKVFYRSELG